VCVCEHMQVYAMFELHLRVRLQILETYVFVYMYVCVRVCVRESVCVCACVCRALSPSVRRRRKSCVTKSSFLLLELRSALALQRSDLSTFLMVVCAYFFLALIYLQISSSKLFSLNLSLSPSTLSLAAMSSACETVVRA